MSRAKAEKTQYFAEGTHLAVLRQITFTKGRRGGFVVFELIIAESTTMTAGAPADYIMRANTGTELGLIETQLRALGLKSPLLFDQLLDVKVIVTAKLVAGRGNEFMVIQLWRA